MYTHTPSHTHTHTHTHTPSHTHTHTHTHTLTHTHTHLSIYLSIVLKLKLIGEVLARGANLVPPTRTKTFGDRTFSVAAPMLWNYHLDYIRLLEKLPQFKKAIKTWLFKICMNHEPYCVQEYFYIMWHVKDFFFFFLL